MKFSIKNKKLLIAEITLLFASVFIFRSLWLLLDMFPIMHKAGMLLIFLALGIALTIPALRFIIKND
jgi:hypothetical protein